ncbi:hypothetical protein AMC82_CH00582 [Rhizobium phaseoli]|nr:hypothetical protein AMC84_CH00584 [Rhizobium phaseoli]ANL77096.1 hypothetical protein AMC82_CH00582 [Rhizobium phaseoli]
MGTRGSALNQEEWRVIRFVDGEFGKTAPPISVIPGLDVKPGYIPDMMFGDMPDTQSGLLRSIFAT